MLWPAAERRQERPEAHTSTCLLRLLMLHISLSVLLTYTGIQVNGIKRIIIDINTMINP